MSRQRTGRIRYNIIRFCGTPQPYLYTVCVLFLIVDLLMNKQRQQSTQNTLIVSSLSSAVNLIDPDEILISNITCIKTKSLLNLYNTTICIHNSSDHVSNKVAKRHIWEEDYITQLLQILIRNPYLDMIDIGANIGSYTMFTAGALGRFTLVVDCYRPNIERIIRAVQIQKVQHRVVIVENALYSKSGEYLKLSNNEPSGKYLVNESRTDLTNKDIVVKTIQFDDLYPILIEKRVRAAIIKIDVKGAQHYLCETGSKIFDHIDIQVVMMEWDHDMRKTYKKQYQSIVDCFTQRYYVTADKKCTLLHSINWETTWPENIYWIKQINFRKNIC
ncbi:unnamed protein product [Adineta steineri]|uniref:Methyltransferase FkbM domain-containing protein n=1 Tax=Adineta steineri TaxID=433720 RepID=A0A815IDF0_9BILA|nr:unnamed protein product [Adineta steineri]CAF3671474.1 unnamed protein product [Adineta steineri]